MKLLSFHNNKTKKSIKHNYLTYVLHLAPGDLSGYETCPKRTPGCTASCLNTAGRGGWFKEGETTNVIQNARIRKTKMFFENRELFLEQLVSDIKLAVARAKKLNLTLAIRLNATSDIPWEKYNVIQQFPNVQFYDYTKIRNRKVKDLPNYHLTFSKAENNDKEVASELKKNTNVAVVFYKTLPDTYLGKPVVSGDETDLRFLDPANSVIGLLAKGRAKQDTSGFVVRYE